LVAVTLSLGLYGALDRAKGADGGLWVLNGGGNRPAVAEVLSKATDLALIPCGIGGQDAVLALAEAYLANSRLGASGAGSANRPRPTPLPSRIRRPGLR
jgi:hypothetical protein